MVFIEELDDEEPQQVAAKKNDEVAASDPPKKEAALAKGFLQKEHEPLYGPEGSKEGYVAPETHKAHTEHKMNENINAQMNRGAKDNNAIDRPPWYTSDWPKDCQYNSPGCTLGEMESSNHETDIHRDMVRRNERWQELTTQKQASMRCSFMQMCDEDLSELLKVLKGNDVVTELDLSHNKIKDQGVQALVAALAKGDAPNLQELRLYSNEFGALGKTMLTQGLRVFRKQLKVLIEEPSYSNLLRA
mmetsp:Transcript_59843/g.110814  ORF Transcript_59843/g.110814 Transcript_59843/m.110814 type:complete len:246 (+) Transcript_59843:70-807(+)